MSKLLLSGLIVAMCCAVTSCKKQTAEASAVTPPSPTVKAEAPVKQAAVAKTFDGPFGLGTKMSLADVTQLGFKQADFAPNIFIGNAPKPLEGIDEYSIVATPEAGACRILAKANVSMVNDTGDQIKEKVDQLAELMATKYGRHTSKTDFVTQDVYRRNPEFWMMALKEDSAFYGYTWTAGKTQQELPTDIASIEIRALAVETKSAWASIKYTFKNFDACASETKKLKAASL